MSQKAGTKEKLQVFIDRMAKEMIRFTEKNNLVFDSLTLTTTKETDGRITYSLGANCCGYDPRGNK